MRRWSQLLRVTNGESGMTLVESLIAIGIFGMSLLALNALMVTTIRTSELARDFASARFLAAQRLEQIKNVRYQDGNRDAYNDTSDPCTDIDEVIAANFPDETYGAVDLLNGTRFTYRSCSAVPDIKSSSSLVTRSAYPNSAQGNNDYLVNHGQYSRFRREVYIVDSSGYTNAIRNVSLSGLNPSARDTVVVDQVTPSSANPASRYVKHVLVRVKWKDNHGKPHHVTLSTAKAFYIPAS